ncbi:MAG: hypothetical protein QM756_41155 [Polyangiaceae bacterium]
MMRTRAWISGFGLAALCGSVFAVVACGGGGDSNGGNGGSSAKGGTTSTGNGGTTSTGNGGTTSTGNGGTTTSNGGSTSTTNGGSSTAGAGSDGPFTCKGTAATCNSIGDFPTTTGQVWGMGDFTGGISVFGSGLMRDTTTTALHITGMVTNYGYGFNLWFTNCSKLSPSTGISFKIGRTASSGTSDRLPAPNQLHLSLAGLAHG